jgi:Glycosyltransferase family 43.
MRKIKKVGIWPVGLVGGLKVEKPVVQDGKVIGFNSMWAPQRPYPIDMAGFAINLDLMKKNENVKFSFDVQKGYQESAILSKVLSSAQELEPLAENCTKVCTKLSKVFYVFNVRTMFLICKIYETAGVKGLFSLIQAV